MAVSYRFVLETARVEDIRIRPQLRITMEVLKLRSRNAKMRGIAEVDGVRAAEAEILSALVDRED